MPVPPRFRRLAWRVRNRFWPKALILMYHRIAQLPADPLGLCVSPGHFGEQLQVLRERARPVSLAELVRGLREGKVPDRGVAITFDDGYADLHRAASPLLQRYQVPGTMFIATGGLGQARLFWWDRLEQLVLWPGTLPATLELAIGGTLHRWELGHAARYTAREAACHQAWKFFGSSADGDPTPRHRLYRALSQLLRPLGDAERDAVLDTLRDSWSPAVDAEAGQGETWGDGYRLLSPGEVAALADTGLVEIGAHTVTHPVLSVLAPSIQEREILGSKAFLEEITGRPVVSFAYPYGMKTDYSEATLALLRSAGFAYACAAFGGLVRRGADLFQLPRVWVPDVGAEPFTRWLEGWLRG